MKKLLIAHLISLSLLPFYTATVYAEPAPVYEADEMPPQFDSADQPQADVMPPPPANDGDNTFVPVDVPNRDNNNITNSPPPTRPVAMPKQPGTGPLEERLERLEQQVYTLQDNKQSSDSSPRIDFLLSQVQALRAQVEKLTNQVSEMQNQPGSTKTVGVVTSKVSVSNDVAPKPTTTLPLKTDGDVVKTSAQPNVAEEQQIYQTAYNLIKQKKYSEAVNTLQSMLKRYPSGQFASNAHYWLGELYGVMGKNDSALKEFEVVVQNYADSPRVADAQLKIGLILAAQLKWSDAKLAFKKVINHYPGTTSSRLAAEQLKQIKQAGH